MNARIFVEERIFKASEDEVREMSMMNTHGIVGVHYAFSYGRSVEQVLKLREAVLKDFPDKEDSRMSIWVLNADESQMHENVMTLYIEIPVEDYLRLKREHRVEIK